MEHHAELGRIIHHRDTSIIQMTENLNQHSAAFQDKRAEYEETLRKLQEAQDTIARERMTHLDQLARGAQQSGGTSDPNKPTVPSTNGKPMEVDTQGSLMLGTVSHAQKNPMVPTLGTPEHEMFVLQQKKGLGGLNHMNTRVRAAAGQCTPDQALVDS